MTRYCPKCGEAVPSNSITCPKCYAKIPFEPAESENKSESSKPKNRDDTIKLILTIIPGLFGILGLGVLYEDSSNDMGYKFLVGGLILYVIGVALIIAPGVLTTILGIGPMILYFLLFLFSIAYTMFNFKAIFRRFRSEVPGTAELHHNRCRHQAHIH